MPVAVYGVVLSLVLLSCALAWWRTDAYGLLLAHYGLSLAGVLFEAYFLYTQVVVAVAGLEQAERAAADEVEGVGHHRVQAVLGGANSTIAPWAGDRSTACEPQLPALPCGQPDALLDDRVEDRADDVERAVDARPGVEHEDAHPLAGRDLERRVDVLVGDAVEDDEVGRRARRHRLVQVDRLALLAEVPLALDERELVLDRRQARRARR